MGAVKQAVAGIALVGCIWLQVGCAEVLVPGTLAGAGEYYRYTTTHVAKKTFMGNGNQVTAAVRNALKKMDIQLHAVDFGDDETEITAATTELDITIRVVPITGATTKVTVNAVKDHVIKDQATATEIISQIQVELDRDFSSAATFPKVFVKNECAHSIDVIVYYLAGKNEPESWQTRGWFSLSPGQKKHVADTHNRYIYFYGETRSHEKVTWTGDTIQWFEGAPYGFFKIDMGTNWVDYTQSFQCD
jgi:sRNA-binding carbon storage regulator CsrA